MSCKVVVAGNSEDISSCDMVFNLVNALASACVFPSSSLEYPLATTTGWLFAKGSRTTRTQPTQNAVGVGMHFFASSRAS
jgi:hypothetical protein